MSKYLEVPGTLERDGDWSRFTVTWGELRSAWDACFFEQTHSLRVNGNHHTFLEFLALGNDGGSRGGWRGFTGANIKKWFNEGYTPGISQLTLEPPDQRPRRKVRVAEEGEYQHDAALSGFDYPFLTWDQRPGKRGVRVLYDLTTSAWTSADALKAYLGWVAEFSHGLEYSGIDYSIGMVNRCSNTFLHDYRTKTETIILVKNEDEAASFQTWSAMLSPAAYRGFMFFAIVLHAEKEGVRCDGSLGSCISAHSFKAELDGDTETIYVSKPMNWEKSQVHNDKLTEMCVTLLENPLDAEELIGG